MKFCHSNFVCNYGGKKHISLYPFVLTYPTFLTFLFPNLVSLFHRTILSSQQMIDVVLFINIFVVIVLWKYQ